MIKKFNSIDWLILIFVLAVIVLGLMKFTSINDNDVRIPAVVTFEASDVPIGLVDAIQEGDFLYDSVSDIYIGEVVGVEQSEHTELVINAFNQPEFKVIPNAYDVKVTVKASLQENMTGYSIENKRIIIGTELRLKSMKYVFDGDIIDLEIQ
jgi:hypothetical protein